MSRIGWIRRQFERNQLLRALWPDLCPWENPKTEAGMWTASHFALNRTEDYTEGTFEAAGVDSGSTGSHYDIEILDDLIGLRSRQDPAFMPRAIEWFQTSPALLDDLDVSLIYVFGTRWAAFDLYSWMQEYETEFEWTIKQIIDDEFSPSSILFPEKFTLHGILELQRKNGELFWLNYMNKAVGAGVTAFDMRKALYFRLVGADFATGAVEFEESNATKQILEIIEKGKNPIEKPPVKKLWELTPEERQLRWNEMQRKWYENKISQIEMA